MKNEIVIYGAGEYGRKILDYLIIKGEKRKIHFCDSNSSLWGKQIRGITIEPFSETMVNEYVFLTGGTKADEIITMLMSRGVKPEKIYRFEPEMISIGNSGGLFYLPKDYLIKPGDIVYSFGIGEDLSFDDEIVKNYDVTLYAFDPTPKAIRYVQNSELVTDKRFHFYSYGIAGKDGFVEFYLPKNQEYVSGSLIEHEGVNDEDRITVEMKKLDTIIGELQHSHINILKMDVEGAEFDIFDDFFSENKQKHIFDLICIELHERFFEESNKIKEKFLCLMKENGYFNWYSNGEEYLFISGTAISMYNLSPLKKQI